MRVEPICRYISSQLHTAVSLCDFNKTLLHQYLPQKEFHNLIFDYPHALSNLLKSTVEQYPVFTFINDSICYAHFSTKDGIYLIGPFRLLFSNNTIHARYTLFIDTLDSLSHITGTYPLLVLDLVLLLYNVYQKTEMTVSECSNFNFNKDLIHEDIKAQTTADLFSNRENQKMHNPYEQEVRLLKSVEEGDLSTLKQIWSEPVTNNLGTTAADPVRNGKNMAIYNVTACGRASIRGGLPAEYVFLLTDSYCQQIENLKDMMLLHSLVQDFEMSFAQMVADLKKRKKGNHSLNHPLLRQCKDYVFQHLHSKLTVQEIADKLHVHPNFLSSLFRAQEGIPLYQYILLQKIELTKNLLTYSNYSYIDIAHYLGFTSQSHLGNRFKAVTGMTLRQYRNAYKQKDFF